MRETFAVAAAAAALAACSGERHGETGGSEAMASAASASAQPPLVAIPEALRGRWGLVRADCTSTRGDAKGLLEVTPDSLRFYEAKATLGTINEGGPERIRATFGFTGEGMEWNREELLELGDGGDALLRREFGEGAMAGALTYHRC